MRRILLLTVLLGVSSSVLAGDRCYGFRSSGYYFRPPRSTFFYRPDYLFNRGFAYPRAYFPGRYGYGYYGRGFSPYYPPGGGFVGGPRGTYVTYVQSPTATEFVRSNASDIVFTVTPSRAQIYVDDKLIGSAQDYSSQRDRYEVINGFHELRIEYPGYKPYRAQMNIEANRTVHVEVELDRAADR